MLLAIGSKPGILKSEMDILVNIVCPQCTNTLVYEDGVGHCLLCASYWTIAGNMVTRTTPPLTDADEARNLAENVQEIMESAPGD